MLIFQYKCPEIAPGISVLSIITLFIKTAANSLCNTQ